MRKSTEMKKILRKEYPDAQFKVRKKGSSMHTAFDVYTDLIKEYDHREFRKLDEKLSSEGLNEKEHQRWKELRSIIEHNKNIRNNIKHNLLKKFWHIDYDDYSGEILSGGNTYLIVNKWSKTKYLK